MLSCEAGWVSPSPIKAYLIGVSHADIALVLAGHIAVDGINIFRADQLIHWNVSIELMVNTYKQNKHTEINRNPVVIEKGQKSNLHK